MKNFYILTDALGYIERNLTQPLNANEIAAACYCSASSLQKLFRLALHLSVKDYIDKRRLTEAARVLLCTDATVTELAFRFQYNSPETFSRAFARLWGGPPSVFRRTKRFSGLFPRINYHFEKGIGLDMAKKQVDISDLHQTLSDMKGAYVLCFDIANLSPINAISHAAGDRAILSAIERIEAESAEGMLLFRIGGDEFALATGLRDAQAASELAGRVSAKNGECFRWEDRDIPLSLWVGMAQIPEIMPRQDELLSRLQRTIDESKPLGAQR